MKLRTVIGLTGATAASFVGMAGLAAGPAGAGGNGAVNLLAQDLGPIPVFGGFFYPGEPGLPFTLPPNVKVSGNCVSAALWLFNDPLALQFTSGTAVLYRIDPISGQPNGLNAVGTATLIDEANPDAPTFSGPAHVWFGQNVNPTANGQSYEGATFAFSGTGPAGSVSFTENPGAVWKAHSAPGANPSSGWGQQNLNCNILPAS